MIVSGFPGVGKTYCWRWEHPTAVVDSDSSKFSWLSKGVRDPDFPQNYIKHIKKLVFTADLIFVSSHKVVRDALVDNGLWFTLVFPEADLKDEYLRRFRGRGSPDSFVNMLDSKWNDFMADLAGQKGCEIIRLKSGEFLSDVLPQPRSPAVKGDEAEACLRLQESEARKLEFPY